MYTAENYMQIPVNEDYLQTKVPVDHNRRQVEDKYLNGVNNTHIYNLYCLTILLYTGIHRTEIVD